MKTILQLFNLTRRTIPKSLWRNTFEPQEVGHSECFSDVRELQPYQTKKVNQLNSHIQRQLKLMYKNR